MNALLFLTFCIIVAASLATSPPFHPPPPGPPPLGCVNKKFSCAEELKTDPNACRDPNQSTLKSCCASCFLHEDCIDLMDCKGMLEIGPGACDDPLDTTKSFRSWCCESCNQSPVGENSDEANNV